jgi:hypothetical protein
MSSRLRREASSQRPLLPIHHLILRSAPIVSRMSAAGDQEG